MDNGYEKLRAKEEKYWWLSGYKPVITETSLLAPMNRSEIDTNGMVFQPDKYERIWLIGSSILVLCILLAGIWALYAYEPFNNYLEIAPLLHFAPVFLIGLIAFKLYRQIPTTSFEINQVAVIINGEKYYWENIATAYIVDRGRPGKAFVLITKDEEMIYQELRQFRQSQVFTYELSAYFEYFRKPL
jgi:hypothetical protein